MPASSTSPLRWRLVDVVVAAVLAIACGGLFAGWNALYGGPATLFGALLPGLQGLLTGPWLIAGPLVGLVIRRPGAALLGELVASAVEFAIVPLFGPITLLYGLVEGFAAEIPFGAGRYRRSGPVVALLSGALAGVGSAVLDARFSYPGASAAFLAVYTGSCVVSGAVFGLIAWALVRALATTGALDRFASGRANRRLV